MNLNHAVAVSSLALATSAALVVAGSEARIDTERQLSADPQRVQTMSQEMVLRNGNVGHPTQADITALGGGNEGGGNNIPPELLGPNDPPDSPLTSGSFVNYESPQIDPLAYDHLAGRLYVANTPNNSVVELDATGPLLIRTREIPVGLDPVALALRPNGDQPPEELWVACRISDRVNVINLSTGRVTHIINTGDEPGTILFTPDGAFAFVVQSGPPLPGEGDPILEESGLVSVNATTKQTIQNLILDINQAKSAVYDASTQTVILAPQMSGNNTTVAGQPILFDLFVDPDNPDLGTTTVSFPDLIVGQGFSLTNPIFTSGGAFGLGEWPDPSPAPETSPVGMRIVPDAGVSVDNPWGDIIAVLSDGMGQPDPAMVAAYEAENPIVANAFEVFEATINDVKDTIDNDLVVIDVSNPSAMGVTKTIGGVGTHINRLGQNAATGDLFALTVQAKNVTRLEPNHKGVFIDHELVIISNVHGAHSITSSNLNAGIPNFDDPSVFNPDAHAMAISDPIDIEFARNNQAAFVVALGSDRLAAIDGVSGAVLGRVDVGRGPRDVELDQGGARAFVMNRTDLSISVVDIASVAAMSVIETFDVFNPEPASITEGRDFLYSTRFSNLNRASCATCHIDAKLDSLAWDLGDHTKATMNDTPHVVVNLFEEPCLTGAAENHPVKGPMVTQSLQGLRDHEPLHWRGDKPIFEDFNSAFEGLLGGQQLSDEDMGRYRNFVMTIEYPPNPHRKPDNTFRDPDAIPGRGLILSCDRCHNFKHDGALNLQDQCANLVGDSAFNLAGLFAQIQLVPQLRDIRKKFNMDRYTGFGLIHDGRDEREDKDTAIHEFLSFFFGFDEMQQDQGAAFLRAWQSNSMPIIGVQTLFQGPTAGGAGQQAITTPNDAAMLNLMIQQSMLNPSRNDVVAKGVIDVQQVSYWMVANDPAVILRDDQGGATTLTDLLNLIETSDSRVFFMAVPPGSGRRIGIDQDNDCLSNGLDPDPQSPRKHGDLNDDGFVGSTDLAQLIGLWGSDNEAADIDNSGAVGSGDLAELLGMWGVCP